MSTITNSYMKSSDSQPLEENDQTQLFQTDGIVMKKNVSGLSCLFFIMLNATFHNISVISWRSVLLLKETRGPEENHSSIASH
jgi:hypothetical protein